MTSLLRIHLLGSQPLSIELPPLSAFPDACLSHLPEGSLGLPDLPKVTVTTPPTHTLCLLSGNYCQIPLGPTKSHYFPPSTGVRTWLYIMPFLLIKQRLHFSQGLALGENVVFNLPIKKKMPVGEDLFPASLCSRTEHVTSHFNCLWSLKTPRSLVCRQSGNSG